MKRVQAKFEFSKDKLKEDILLEAKKLHVDVGTAEAVAEKVATNVAKWVEKRTTVTMDDINRRVGVEIAKYNMDLAYVYQNRGKII